MIILSVSLGVFAVSHLRCLHAQEISLIEKSTIDPEALTFAEGPATRFGRVVNGRTHQQTPLTTYRGYQYATYFDSARRVCIARRKLPSGSWEVIRFADHRFASNDSHNTAVLGICDADGTIHMAFDHHATRLNYRFSKRGAAHEPGKVKWDVSLFSGIRHKLGSVTPHRKITYPRFFSAPNGNLMLYYRSVTSANGDGMIEEYDGKKHAWTPGLGKFISRDKGVYKFEGKSSRFRCPYLNSISFSGKRLHVSWIWRDRFEKTSVRHQHSLCYAYSEDNGRSWNNSAGERIGETGKSPIHLDSKDLVVAEIPSDSGLSNQNTHYAYPDGRIHVMLLQTPADGKRKTYHHHWRSAEGEWQVEALPYSGTRPKLLGGKDRSLLLFYTSRSLLQIARGTPRPAGGGWKWKRIDLDQPHPCFGEAIVDLERWNKEEILSVYSQAAPRRILKTKDSIAVSGIPSPLNVTDYRILTPRK
ncbi:MAG: BNR repeat-containing protein [Akkermansiaceae bacterium]